MAAMDRRAIGSWLSGPWSALGSPQRGHRGMRYGLPESGPGSVASFGRRILALAIDWWVALLIGLGLLRLGQAWVPVILAAEYVLLLPTLGMTIGMRLLGIRVLNLHTGGLPRWPAVLVRTALLLPVLPAVIADRDGRGLHDRAAGTIVVDSGLRRRSLPRAETHTRS